MTLIPIPDDHVGTVVTFLEMTERPDSLAGSSAPLRLERWARPDFNEYRQLFRRVGERWLWYSRLAMDDVALGLALGEVHVVEDSGATRVGMVELDFGVAGECLIRFLGLVPELAGGGHGRWLFAQVLALAWRPGIARVHVNTCSLDHPAALPA